jgi:glycosyltransferase involved in cell wall biosynthesis
VCRPFIRLIARGTDTFPALSSKIADEIKTVYNGRSCLLQLGPDASYYPQDTQSGEGVIAAGRTGRDFITFGMAASQTGVNARIICLRSSASPAFKSFNSNIQITVYPDEDYMKYPQLLRLYAKSRVLAIPLLPQENLCGLTSLMDALGMGKPVIMTRNRFIDIDIEKEGIGKWVEPFDIEGWKRAICWFEDNRDKAISMGRRARELVDKGLNSAAFANRIMDMFDTLLKRKI